MFFQDENLKKEINNYLKQGGVIAFVTDTVWGVGCLPESKQGAQNIYELKNRDFSKPLILMSNDIKYLTPYIKSIPNTAKKLIEKHFPGALTLIFEKTEKTPDFITSNKNTVGIRIPNNPVFAQLCEIIDGHVLATTSANLSGQEPAKTHEEAVEKIGNNVKYIFQDYGYACQGKASTVALALDNDIKVLRQGEIKII